MKKIYIALLFIVGLVLVAVFSTAAYLKFYLPDIAKSPEITVEQTIERVERGRYLANHITVCMDCHSTRDWSKFAGPLAGNFGGGGERFDQEMGFPGTIYSPNITPYNLADWTDGELYRTITTGVNREGKALFPVMPYHDYGKMDKEDIYSIIAYIRTLESVETTNPERELDFPVSLLVNTMPVEAEHRTKPAESDRLNYGQYLVSASGCVHCHSQRDKGATVPGTEFGGGMEFGQPAGILRTPNITPHEKTGIGSWSQEAFVSRFKLYADSTYEAPTVTLADFNTPMPWGMYAGMKESDLEAMYIYLKSLKPIDHAIERFQKN
ncbi:c-type cytochrome [Gynurincola endophyticus]|uniref:c-type cytochrome n=1 Tax=Gynurincola endophyticus TaxID=2479004 RepID=UPI000F8D38CA|nr:c-type cytochrome [Gynurincola endophyticus]